MSLTNYHTHSTFCDGKNTPEEIVNRAIALGFDEIGFSSHSENCTNPDAYRQAINELKEKYTSQLTYYKKACRLMFGKDVDEALIYSVPMGKTVEI